VSERYLCEAFTGVCHVVCAWFHMSNFSGVLVLELGLSGFVAFAYLKRGMLMLTCMVFSTRFGNMKHHKSNLSVVFEIEPLLGSKH
jgi:hypothetical protein